MKAGIAPCFLLGKSMKNGEALGIKSDQETRLGLAWRRVCEFVCAYTSMHENVHAYA